MILIMIAEKKDYHYHYHYHQDQHVISRHKLTSSLSHFILETSSTKSFEHFNFHHMFNPMLPLFLAGGVSGNHRARSTLNI